MDDKLTPSNSAGAVDRSPAVKPEDLQAGAAGAEGMPAEMAPTPGSSPQASPPPVQSQSAPVKLSTDQVAAAIAASTSPVGPLSGVPTPSAAGDVDVIEPEWVEKAETVVAEHQGDPYGEEEAIEDLQQDYLKKRYGYDVSNPNSDSSKPEGT
ncbi:MAG TPA: hypothetical protein VMS08_03180 [Candidatus Saccharimonadia bacterium]|jgi:hypothetical protein|nr:hypothetical protein [Candidatus Saccharimonadia bacterium]